MFRIEEAFIYPNLFENGLNMNSEETSTCLIAPVVDLYAYVLLTDNKA